MSFGSTIAEDEVTSLPVGQLALKSVDELACTGWSAEEKEAFLKNEENQALLREFSAANRKRIEHALWTYLAFD